MFIYSMWNKNYSEYPSTKKIRRRSVNVRINVQRLLYNKLFNMTPPYPSPASMKVATHMLVCQHAYRSPCVFPTPEATIRGRINDWLVNIVFWEELLEVFINIPEVWTMPWRFHILLVRSTLPQLAVGGIRGPRCGRCVSWVKRLEAVIVVCRVVIHGWCWGVSVIRGIWG